MSPTETEGIDRALQERHSFIWARLPATCADEVRALATARGTDAAVWTVTGSAGWGSTDHAGTLAEAARFLATEAPPVVVLRDLPPPPYDAGLERSLLALVEAASRHGCQLIVLADQLDPPQLLRRRAVLPGESEASAAAPNEPVTEDDGTPIPVRRRLPFPVATLCLAVVQALPMLALIWLVGFSSSLWSSGIQNDIPLIFLGAKVNALIATGEYWRLVTSAFLSASLMHFLLNLATLAVAGSAVEALYGRARMVTLFVLAGAAGAAASFKFNALVTVAGSAPLVGLLAALVVHQRKYRDALPPGLTGRLQVVTLLALGQGILAALDPRVDAWSLLGGAVAGALLGYLLEGRMAGDEQGEREALPLPAAGLTAVALLILGLAGITINFRLQRPLLLGSIAESQQQHPIALEQYRLAAARQPQLVELQIQLARLLLRAGDLDEAQAHFANYIRARPGDANARRQFAMLLGLSEKFPEAARHLEEYLQLQPEDDEAHLMLVEFLARAGRWPDGRRHLADRMASRPGDERLRGMAIGILISVSARLEPEGHPQQAVEALRDALALVREPNQRAHVENNLSYLLANALNERLDEALALVQSALKVEPDNAAYLDTLAWVHYRQKRYSEALPVQQEALRRMGQQFRGEGAAELHYHMGAIREALGQRQEARGDYRRALAADPRFAPARDAFRRMGGDPPTVVPPPRTRPAPPGNNAPDPMRNAPDGGTL